MNRNKIIDLALIFLILIFIVIILYAIKIYNADSFSCLSNPIEYIENKNNLTCSCTERNQFDYKYFDLNLSKG